MLENTERKGAQEQSLLYTLFCSLRQRNFRIRAIRIRGQGSGVRVSRQGSGSVRENWKFTDPLEPLVSFLSREAAKECSPRRKPREKWGLRKAPGGAKDPFSRTLSEAGASSRWSVARGHS